MLTQIHNVCLSVCQAFLYDLDGALLPGGLLRQESLPRVQPRPGDGLSEHVHLHNLHISARVTRSRHGHWTPPVVLGREPDDQSGDVRLEDGAFRVVVGEREFWASRARKLRSRSPNRDRGKEQQTQHS